MTDKTQNAYKVAKRAYEEAEDTSDKAQRALAEAEYAYSVVSKAYSHAMDDKPPTDNTLLIKAQRTLDDAWAKFEEAERVFDAAEYALDEIIASSWDNY